jgi:hypothetical protein
MLLAVLLFAGSIVVWQREVGPDHRWRSRRMVVADPRSQPFIRRPEFLRVLFIGNSFTNYYGGQGLIGTRLASSAATKPSRLAIFDQSTEFGATLEWHWKHGDARGRIREGHWDYVVLQDHSEGPLKDRESFFTHAKLFNEAIHQVGAKTVLFMTWPKVNEPENGPVLAEMYEQLGHELGADVVPVGRAFAALLARRPSLTLHALDLKHPTAAGSYLAGCCFYSYFYKQSPIGLTRKIRDDEGETWIDLAEDDALALQETAYRTVTQPENQP